MVSAYILHLFLCVLVFTLEKLLNWAILSGIASIILASVTQYTGSTGLGFSLYSIVSTPVSLAIPPQLLQQMAILST